MSMQMGTDRARNEPVNWGCDDQYALSLHGKIEEGWVACFCKKTGCYYPCKSAENKLADMKEIRIMKSLKGKEDIGIKKPRSIDDDYDKKGDISGLASGWDAYVHKKTKECYVCNSIVKDQYNKKQIDIMEVLMGKENIGIKDVYVDKDCVKILMEPCVGDRLSERIEMKKKHFYREAAELTGIMVKVIETCHSRGVTLGNLKETFIFANKNDDSSLKAVYFESAEKPGKDIDEKQRKDIEEKQRKDIQLAGEILYLLLTGEKKMPAAEIKKIKENTLKSSEWVKLPQGAKFLIQKMLGEEPLTAKKVLGEIKSSINQAGADHTRLKTAATNLKRIKIGENPT